MNERSWWIAAVWKDHVDRAIAGGFGRVDHGKAGTLQRARAHSLEGTGARRFASASFGFPPPISRGMAPATGRSLAADFPAAP